MTLNCELCQNQKCEMTHGETRCCRCITTGSHHELYVDCVGWIDLKLYYLNGAPTMNYCRACRDPDLVASRDIYDLISPYIRSLTRLVVLSKTNVPNKSSMRNKKRNTLIKCNYCRDRVQFISNFIDNIVAHHVQRDNIGVTVCDDCAAHDDALLFSDDLRIIHDAIDALHHPSFSFLIKRGF